jgi:hypothetical protein
VWAYDSRTQNVQPLSGRGQFAFDPVVAIGGDGVGSAAWVQNDASGDGVVIASRQGADGLFPARGRRVTEDVGSVDVPQIDANARGDTIVIGHVTADDELGESFIDYAVAGPGPGGFGKFGAAESDLDVYDPGDVGLDAAGGAVLAFGANPGLTGKIQVVSAFYTP